MAQALQQQQQQQLQASLEEFRQIQLGKCPASLRGCDSLNAATALTSPLLLRCCRRAAEPPAAATVIAAAARERDGAAGGQTATRGQRLAGWVPHAAQAGLPHPPVPPIRS